MCEIIGFKCSLLKNKCEMVFSYLVIGPGDSVNALNDERIWLWKEPIQDADFFMPSVSLVVLGETRAVSSSFILMMTWADLDLGLSWSSNLVHARSRDDRSVAILSGFTVISSQTYLNQKENIQNTCYSMRVQNSLHFGPLLFCVSVNYDNLGDSMISSWFSHVSNDWWPQKCWTINEHFKIVPYANDFNGVQLTTRICCLLIP